MVNFFYINNYYKFKYLQLIFGVNCILLYFKSELGNPF